MRQVFQLCAAQPGSPLRELYDRRSDRIALLTTFVAVWRVLSTLRDLPILLCSADVLPRVRRAAAEQCNILCAMRSQPSDRKAAPVARRSSEYDRARAFASRLTRRIHLLATFYKIPHPRSNSATQNRKRELHALESFSFLLPIPCPSFSRLRACGFAVRSFRVCFRRNPARALPVHLYARSF